MLKYNKFYRAVGVRLLSDFISPKLIKLNTLEFPRYSILHIFNPKSEFYINNTAPILAMAKDKFLYNVFSYTKQIFPVKDLIYNESTNVKALAKKHRGIDILPSYRWKKFVTKKPKALARTLPVINYNQMQYVHKYMDLPRTPYEEFINATTTLVDTIVNIDDTVRESKKLREDLHQFITLEVPTNLYNVNIFRKYATATGDPSIKMLDILHSTEHKLLLELITLLDTETERPSVLTPLTTDGRADRVSFIFTYVDKAIVVNLGKLLSFIKDSEYPGSAQTTGDNVIKVLHVMLKKLVLAGTASVIDTPDADEIESEDTNAGEISIDDEGFDRVSFNTATDKEFKIMASRSEQELDDESMEDTITSEQDVLRSIEKTKIEVLEGSDTSIVEEYVNKYDGEATTDLTKPEDPIVNITTSNLDEQLANGDITKAKHKKLVELLDATLNKDLWGDGVKTKDMLTLTPEEVEITAAERKLPVVPVALADARDAEDPIGVLDTKYLDKVYKKDLTASILTLSKAGLIAQDIEVISEDTILGKFDTYAITINDNGKSKYKVSIKVPTVDEDGVYMMSGNKYRLRRQKADFPIKKIKYNRVALTTAYSKLFVDKAPLKRYDLGFSIMKEILRLGGEKKISKIVTGSAIAFDIEVPTMYAVIGRYLISFKYKNIAFNFKYDNRKELIPGFDLSSVEKNGSVLVGVGINKRPVVMDSNGIISEHIGKEAIELGHILDYIPVERAKLKKEFSMVRIYKNYIPVALMMSYYMGMENMLKSIGVEYEVLSGNKRIEGYHVSYFKTADKTIIMKATTPLQLMIINGLEFNVKHLRQISWAELNNKTAYGVVWKELGLKLNIITEIKAMENLFVDPVTGNILRSNKEPDTMLGLLVRSSELLVDDNFKDPIGYDEFVMKSYERIPQYIYSTLTKAIRTKMNEEFFGKSKLTVDPYEVWRTINADGAGVLVDDLNPLLFLKQKEDTTLTGVGGRSKDAIGKDARGYHPDDIGVMSEGVKDSGDVAITAYLSANPVLNSLRGTKDKSVDVKDMAWSSIVSTSTMLAPFSLYDDPKRVNYANIQNSHIIPTGHPSEAYVRTGYEGVVSYRAGPKFVGIAKEDGKVTKVTKDEMTVIYKDSGKTKYDISDWTNKEESNTTYKHIMLANFSEGDKFKLGDALYYDSGFFSPDIFDTTKVIYRSGTNLRLAMMEVGETYEDSSMISSKASKVLNISYVKIRDLTLNVTDAIANVLDINTEVAPNTPLFTIGSGLGNEEELSKDTMDLLQGFIKTTPKAKYEGKIIKVQVFYNSELKDISNSLKKLITMSEKFMILDGKKQSGKVNSSYSVRGIPLDEGKVHIKFYIEIESSMGTGDKGIVANQLKSTISTAYDYDIVDEHGNEIDGVFSMKGVFARIVNSAMIIGAASLCMELIGKRAVDHYFKK